MHGFHSMAATGDDVMHAAVLENFGGSLAEQEITGSDSNAGR
jgi:hypothetical protein